MPPHSFPRLTSVMGTVCPSPPVPYGRSSPADPGKGCRVGSGLEILQPGVGFSSLLTCGQVGLEACVVSFRAFEMRVMPPL